MEIRDYIKYHIRERNRTNLSISQELEINYKTFVGKLNRESITAEELLKISVILDINLEKMKEDLNYQISSNEKKYEIFNSKSKLDDTFKESNSVEPIDKDIKSKETDQSNLNNKANIVKAQSNISEEVGSIRLRR